MFNDYPEAAGMGYSMSCKPDPEELLQNARKRVEECSKAIDLLFELNNMSIDVYFGSNSRDAAFCAVGSLTFQKQEAEKNVQRWLDEIDKS